MTLRKSDYLSEHAVSEFLNRHFYPVYFSNFCRYADEVNQFSGIDVSFDFQDQKNLLVDEKAAAHYVNKNLPTFAFELDFLGSDGKPKPGWLFDNKKQTQYYLLNWIWAKKEKGYSVDDITKLEVVLIKRKALIQFLETHGLDANKASHISRTFRASSVYGKHLTIPFAPFYFYFTGFLSEKPINVIVRKEELIKLSVLHQFVKP